MIDWEDLVLTTAERFGGTLPHPDTAAAIAQVYARAPHAVERAIDRIATEYDQGNIRSPWGILKSRVQQIQTEAATTSKANDRDATIARAEQWIKTAGLHMDWPEVEAELFAPELHTPPAEWLIDLERETRDQPGRPIYDSLLKASIEHTMSEGPQRVPDSAGLLRHHDTPQLRERFHGLWQTQRPLGITAELEHEARLRTWAEQNAARQKTARDKAKAET